MEATSALEQLSRVIQMLRMTMYSTQIEFAAALGVSRSAVSGWENGSRSPTRVQTSLLWRWCNRYELFQSSTIVLDGHPISPDDFDGLMAAARQGV